LITPALIHNQIDDNKTIEFNGFITRKLDKEGRISIIINLIELITQQTNKFSEEEIKKITLINQKIEQGFKDLDAFIKNAIFNNRRFPPAMQISSANFSPSNMWISETTTFAPAVANNCAAAFPIPDAAPVIITVLFFIQ
jgi:hypothetical protein